MPPRRNQDTSDESSDESSVPAIARKGRFDDEEDDENVLESWDAAEDSDVQREKAKQALEAKQRAEAAAAANKKSRSQRIEDRRLANQRLREEQDESSSEEDTATARARARQREQDADLRHAEDLIGNIGLNKSRTTSKTVVITDPSNPESAIDLSSLSIFDPRTKDDFNHLRQSITPLISSNSRKAHYILFVQDFCKELVRDLPSDQIKKVASGLTTLSNEKMKEEKASDKGGKKTKAAKTKATLVASRDTGIKADTTAYDDDLGDDDFM